MSKTRIVRPEEDATEFTSVSDFYSSVCPESFQEDGYAVRVLVPGRKGSETVAVKRVTFDADMKTLIIET